jgi:hypothetical protein
VGFVKSARAMFDRRKDESPDQRPIAAPSASTGGSPSPLREVAAGILATGEAPPETERPPAVDAALWTALVGMKSTILAVAVDAVVNHDAPRYRGKAMRTRAVGYVGAVWVVPLAWRLLPDRGRYPRGLDLAVSVPLVLDAVGNARGVYMRAHVDDVVHLANGAIVAGVAGALFAPRVDERWQAALAGAAFGVVAQTLWEIMEYTAYRLGARGMDLSYHDTMHDMIESTLGAVLGGLFTFARMSRSKGARERTGWRSVVGA